MNYPSSLSIYDGLCKLCVGILLLAWLPFSLRGSIVDSQMGIEKGVAGVVFVIFAFIVGNIWHHLFIERIFKCMINNEHDIKLAYEKVYGKSYNKDINININPNDYFKAYYRAEQGKLLGTVHMLEALEAFIRSSFVIIFCYSGAFVLYANLSIDDRLDIIQRIIYSALSILVSILWILLRQPIQDNIYKLVWEADLYFKTNKQND